jgi:hypothetical protein
MLHSAAKTKIRLVQGHSVGTLNAWRASMVILLQRTFHFFTPEGSRLLKHSGFDVLSVCSVVAAILQRALV